ncbi:MAG: hypothetical protein KIT79_00995 [Deltaproteobacteria bacterium]|nr:hypothetical protein [Deltaproteobacteria bacterium]
MNEFIENLKKFNRKERYHLICHSTQNAFNLCPDFIYQLRSQLDIPIPHRAFVAMDYHLDWIWGAMAVLDPKLKEQNRGTIKGTQEDIDLIIAYEEGNTDKELVTRLIFVEAKSDTSWSNEQFTSKTSRLALFFPEGEKDVSNLRIIPHLVLTSPSKPTKKLDKTHGAKWMWKEDGEAFWIKLRTELTNFWKIKTQKDGMWNIVDSNDLTVSFSEATEADGSGEQ